MFNAILLCFHFLFLTLIFFLKDFYFLLKVFWNYFEKNHSFNDLFQVLLFDFYILTYWVLIQEFFYFFLQFLFDFQILKILLQYLFQQILIFYYNFLTKLYDKNQFNCYFILKLWFYSLSHVLTNYLIILIHFLILKLIEYIFLQVIIWNLIRNSIFHFQLFLSHFWYLKQNFLFLLYISFLKKEFYLLIIPFN